MPNDTTSNVRELAQMVLALLRELMLGAPSDDDADSYDISDVFTDDDYRVDCGITEKVESIAYGAVVDAERRDVVFGKRGYSATIGRAIKALENTR